LLLNIKGNKEEVDYTIGLPYRYITRCSTLYKDVLIMIGGRRFPRDLIQFNLSEFDVILGMDWLTVYRAGIDCRALKVILRNSKG